MGFKKGQNFNHPVKGAAIKVDPIRRKKDIELIKFNLKDKPHDLCLFTLGINTAFRANELLSLTVEQVKGLKSGDVLRLRESKTGKHRQVTLNPTAYEAIQGGWVHCRLAMRSFCFLVEGAIGWGCRRLVAR